MQVIVNKEQTDLTFSFEGYDYTFAAGKPAQVEDNLSAHLQELVPLAFDFKPELKKITVVAKVHRVPTKNVFPGGKFGTQSANLTKLVVDETPESGKTDKDGVDWYGPGLETDKV